MSFQGFWWEVIKRAFAGRFWLAEKWSGGAALLYAAVVFYLHLTGKWETAATWVPFAVFLGVFVAAVVVGLMVAPYQMYREKEERLVQLEAGSPLAISLSQTYTEYRDGQHFWVLPITVRNALPNRSINGVEVHLLKIARHAPQRGGYRDVNLRLIERASGVPSFNLLPGMPRDVLFVRKAITLDRDECFAMGPLEQATGEILQYGPGHYKVDIAVYGDGVQAAHEALSVGLDSSGAMSCGRWRDDLPWPMISTKPRIAEVRPPESPPSTTEESQP